MNQTEYKSVRHLLLIISFIGCAHILVAQSSGEIPNVQQDETIKTDTTGNHQPTRYVVIPNPSPRIGGYGSLMLRLASFDKELLAQIVFRAALLVNNRIAYGVEIQSIIPMLENEILIPPDPKRLLPIKVSGNGAGIFVEPVLLPNKLIHIVFPVSVGGGVLRYTRSWTQQDGWEYAGMIDQDFYWYVHPGVHAELNLSTMVRTGVGLSYRIANNLTLMDTPKNAFTGLCGLLFVKIGLF